MNEISTICYKCHKGSKHSDSLGISHPGGWMVLEGSFREGKGKNLSEETFE